MSELDVFSGRLSEKNVSNKEIEALIAHVQALVGRYGSKKTPVSEQLIAHAHAVESMGLAKKDNKIIEYHDDPVEILTKNNEQKVPFAVEKAATAYLRNTMQAMDVLREKMDRGVALSDKEQKVWDDTLKNYDQIASLYPHRVKETKAFEQKDKNSYADGREREIPRELSKQSRQYSMRVPSRGRI